MKIYQGFNSLTLTVGLKSGMFHTESNRDSSLSFYERLEDLMAKCTAYAVSVDDSLLDTEVLVYPDDIDINAIMDDANLQSISAPVSTSIETSVTTASASS